MSHSVNRRSFLKGAALTAAAGLAAVGAAGCSPQMPATGEAGTAATSEGAHTWEIAPEPIAEDQIAETHEAEIVVVGAGIAGCSAAMTGAEAGASVICVQKHTGVLTNGGAMASYNSKLAREAGIEIDVNDLFDTWSTWAENRVDRQMFNLWATYSGSMVDWLADHATAGGCEIMLDAPLDPATIRAQEFKDRVYPDMIVMLPDMQTAMEVLCENAQKLGAQFYFAHEAIQLGREGDGETGRVDTVYARNDDGAIIAFRATKGIILCAGDYANNMEMRQVWAPHLADLESPYAPPVNTGDGLIMGLRVGAAMDLGPHCSNIHYDVSTTDPYSAWCGSGGTPWLRVNVNGERFSNEDTAYQQIYAQDVMQPEHRHFQVFDSGYPAQWPTFTTGCMRGCGPVYGPSGSQGIWLDALEKAGIDAAQFDGDEYQIAVEGGVANGAIYKADTIADLASQMGVDAGNLQKTVERYSELAKNGSDDDFGKPAQYLFPIETPPFYAIPRKARPLGVLNGLRINYAMQVLDGDGNVIEGLWAAGNNSGGNFFGGMVQPMCAPAMTTSRACLTGRLAALSVLGEDFR